MHDQAGLRGQTDVPPPRRAADPRGVTSAENKVRERKRRPKLPIDGLAFRTVAAFRAHPHISNVLTHISRADWARVEGSLAAILDPATTSERLSPLERNIIDLMCADRGITGRILKPYFHALLHKLLEPRRAGRIIRHIDALFLEIEWKAQQPVCTLPALGSLPAEEPDHVRNESR